MGAWGRPSCKRLVFVELSVTTNDAHTEQSVTMTRINRCKGRAAFVVQLAKGFNHREFLLGVANQQRQSR